MVHGHELNCERKDRIAKSFAKVQTLAPVTKDEQDEHHDQKGIVIVFR